MNRERLNSFYYIQEEEDFLDERPERGFGKGKGGKGIFANGK